MIKSYAKINIGLKVLEKRKDGFHDIDSYFHIIDLYDEIYPSATESRCLSVAIEGNAGYLDRGLDIMEKAAIAFSKATGLVFSLDVRIKKRIPSKAGLGGGSSNGAAILKYLNEYFSHPLDEKGLADVALSVGSDLPFFISGLSAARVQGRGELISPCGLLTGDVDLFLPSFFETTSMVLIMIGKYARSCRGWNITLQSMNTSAPVAENQKQFTSVPRKKTLRPNEKTMILCLGMVTRPRIYTRMAVRPPLTLCITPRVPSSPMSFITRMAGAVTRKPCTMPFRAERQSILFHSLSKRPYRNLDFSGFT